MSSLNYIVAVHAGAGFHSVRKEIEYKAVCRAACLQAIQLLCNGGTAVDAVTEATGVLEDAQCTNAGYGSSLTIDGTVECDASVMDGEKKLFGAVGSLEGVKNPVKAASRLIEVQKNGHLSHGRIPPSILVGHGAKKWCEQMGIDTCDPALLVTDTSKRMHLKYCRRIDGNSHKGEGELKRAKYEQHDLDEDFCEGIQDTVGAVCMDSRGCIAAASSSGGIWLKHSGRIGPAATYGAGCWAKNRTVKGSHEKPGVAVTTSGSGEDIMRSLLAKTCADLVENEDNIHQAVSYALDQEFLGHGNESSQQKNGGVLVLKNEDIGSAELLWAHSTDSMCIGYMSSVDKIPKTFISRLPHDSKSGFSTAMEGKFFDFLCKK